MLLELAVIHLHDAWLRSGHSLADPFPFLVLYVCPTKALCREVFTSWSAKFLPYNLRCLVGLLGTPHARRSPATRTPSGCVVSASPVHVEETQQLAHTTILFTTPEKLEILSRRWSVPSAGDALAGRIRLLLIDEIHLLNEPRGANIETVVARLRSRLSSPPSLRASHRCSGPHPHRHTLRHAPQLARRRRVASGGALLLRRLLPAGANRPRRAGLPQHRRQEPLPLREVSQLQVASVSASHAESSASSSATPPTSPSSSSPPHARDACGLFSPLSRSSLANQLLADCDRNGLAAHGFLSAELQQGSLSVPTPT